MKTKIRTRQAICILAIIGLMNINAIADNKKSANTEVVAVKEEMLTNELKRSEETFFNSAEALTAMEADAQIDKYATKQILLKENTIAKSDFQATAESITASGTDREIEKYALKQVALEQTRIGK
ncbi:MAG TPA: hypothetical protein VF373_13930 [Prolixibacteraceae bacterium]